MFRFRRAAAIGLFLGMMAPTFGRAEQFVLFDVTFTFTKEDADNSKPSKSHYYVKGDMLNPDRPFDWTAPVDYRNGTVHIRAEVIEKPAGSEPTTWTLCYIPNKGKGNGYGCTGTDLYREKGVYEKDVSMKEFWENDSILWTEGIKQMDLVIKDNSGGRGHAHKRPDWEKFFPTKMRITMVQVSAGSTYDPSLVPNLSSGAGGAVEKPQRGAIDTGQDARCCAGCDEPDERPVPSVRLPLSSVSGVRRHGEAEVMGTVDALDSIPLRLRQRPEEAVGDDRAARRLVMGDRGAQAFRLVYFAEGF